MDRETRSVLIAHIATLAGFKLVTSILILAFFPSWHALIVIVALSVPWVAVGLWYGGVVSRIRLRLVRARMRRKKMLHQEWNVD
jgi:hypothetical protein